MALPDIKDDSLLRLMGSFFIRNTLVQLQTDLDEKTRNRISQSRYHLQEKNYGNQNNGHSQRRNVYEHMKMISTLKIHSLYNSMSKSPKIKKKKRYSHCQYPRWRNPLTARANSKC